MKSQKIQLNNKYYLKGIASASLVKIMCINYFIFVFYINFRLSLYALYTSTVKRLNLKLKLTSLTVRPCVCVAALYGVKPVYEITEKFQDNIVMTNAAVSRWDTIAVMMAFAVVLSVLLITISFLLAVKKPDAEKLSPYECGFEPFGMSRQKFDIRYYLVSLLFILFDLEVVYLFPLIAVDWYHLKNTGFIIAIIFIAILAIGIVYEFSKKALESV